jgi:hypothetical protein
MGRIPAQTNPDRSMAISIAGATAIIVGLILGLWELANLALLLHATGSRIPDLVAGPLELSRQASALDPGATREFYQFMPRFLPAVTLCVPGALVIGVREVWVERQEVRSSGLPSRPDDDVR